jgi:ABC-type transport system involved in Fe-S cluster assembly fused permease/ATPase subunit
MQSASRADVVRAARAAKLDEFIERGPRLIHAQSGQSP